MTTNVNEILMPFTIDQTPIDTKKLLQDLGKPTRRGIRKCTKCGTYTGTKAVVCKNKDCDSVFKDSCEKRNANVDAVKLISDNYRQLFSVRVRDSGPDYRGFVQLPIASADGNILSEVALCFVDSCQRLFHESILRCHENIQGTKSGKLCVHINSALRSTNLAGPLVFRQDVIQFLNIPVNLKQQLWLLGENKTVPIVQRVSRCVMAVKCQVTAKHPLGYLHVVFKTAKGRIAFEKCMCTCTGDEAVYEKINKDTLKCVHYYSCICCMLGDPKLYEEFEIFLNMELSSDILQPLKNLLFSKRGCQGEHNSTNIENYPERVKTKEKLKKPSVVISKNKGKYYRKEIITKCKKIYPKIFPVQIKILNEKPNAFESVTKVGKNELVWPFNDWLSHVTESINNSMKFENFGLVNSLIFLVPFDFYLDFRKRIPAEYLREKIIDASYEIIQIMNIADLKKIFETPQIKLRISKKFVHSNDGGYIEDNGDEDDQSTYKSSFIYFLNVGQLTVDESDDVNNVFLIEWVPNILSVTKVGQLKLQYKYGRKCT